MTIWLFVEMINGSLFCMLFVFEKNEFGFFSIINNKHLQGNTFETLTWRKQKRSKLTKFWHFHVNVLKRSVIFLWHKCCSKLSLFINKKQMSIEMLRSCYSKLIRDMIVKECLTFAILILVLHLDPASSNPTIQLKPASMQRSANKMLWIFCMAQRIL